MNALILEEAYRLFDDVTDMVDYEALVVLDMLEIYESACGHNAFAHASRHARQRNQRVFIMASAERAQKSFKARVTFQSVDKRWPRK